MKKTNITDLPLRYDREYVMTIVGTISDTLLVSIDGRKYYISTPKNISWHGISLYKGMVCTVVKEVYYSGKRKFAKLELIKVIRDSYYEKENNYSETASYNSNMKYYEILGCTIDATLEQIKSSYKKLIRQYHYDILASKNLPDDMMLFAEKRAKEINQAYEELKKLV